MARSVKNNKPFKDALISFYGDERKDPRDLRCMLTDQRFSQHCVVAAHLVPCSLKAEAQVDIFP